MLMKNLLLPIFHSIIVFVDIFMSTAHSPHFLKYRDPTIYGTHKVGIVSYQDCKN